MKIPFFAFVALRTLAVYIIVHKLAALVWAVPNLPASFSLFMLSGFSFYLYLSLLLVKPWAWLLAFGLNALGLMVFAVMWVLRHEVAMSGFALDNLVMVVLLYLGRNPYLTGLLPQVGPATVRPASIRRFSSNGIERTSEEI
jgi:hypothetical protein